MKKVLITFICAAMIFTVNMASGAGDRLQTAQQKVESMFKMSLKKSSARSGSSTRVKPVVLQGKDVSTKDEISIPQTPETMFVKMWFVDKEGKPFNPFSHRFDANEYFEVYVQSNFAIKFRIVQTYPQHSP